MKVIGITGGIGAGKTTVLNIIRECCNCRIIIADEVAKELEKKGNSVYVKLVELLTESVLAPDEEIDKKAMAGRIFSDESGELLAKVNAIIHPLVKEYILDAIELEKGLNNVDYLVVEAALLIEDGYMNICDEMWYIYASSEVRTRRLIESRGYSMRKIADIMSKQSDDSVFRKHCKYVIENNEDIEYTRKQIEEILKDKR